MSVAEALSHLLALQEIDGRIRAAEAEVAGLPDRLAVARTGVQAAEERVSQARAALETAELEQRRLEGEVSDREALIQRLEGQTSQVKTNDAYRALLSEIEQAREAISERETAVLEAMETIEAASDDAERSRNELRAAEESLKATESTLTRRRQELESQLEREREMRGVHVGALEPSVITLYDRVSSRHTKPVAVVSHQVCNGCRTQIPAQQWIQVLEVQAVLQCARCQRILVPAVALGGDRAPTGAA